VDTSVDTGPILAQKPVDVEPIDTGETLYRKLELACIDLFREAWPSLSQGRLQPHPQNASTGTKHRIRDVERVDRIDLDRAYQARDLINILRARTFAGQPGAFFESEDGQRVNVRISLEYHNEGA
jgi:methionyl-tRNA formyltransferase